MRSRNFRQNKSRENRTHFIDDAGVPLFTKSICSNTTLEGLDQNRFRPTPEPNAPPEVVQPLHVHSVPCHVCMGKIRKTKDITPRPLRPNRRHRNRSKTFISFAFTPRVIWPRGLFRHRSAWRRLDSWISLRKNLFWIILGIVVLGGALGAWFSYMPDLESRKKKMHSPKGPPT